ncbi:alanine--tRNA ligase [soil metagenome]
MTAAEIRQSFLDFFAAKGHTIVPSASLMPTSPNLLFTNAGMNQFVPYFLGAATAPYDPPRAADTQKCIRAGGKHNDLEDVGYDTYHHTFFEMLGNWSFGDYFKEEAIAWAWELLTERWGFPPGRLYASVYQPGEGDPAGFDQEAYDLWTSHFVRAGLDPDVHVVFGGKKDNFWMMGDTGPCGPCSELHIDLTPSGDSQGRLVNADNPHCIEIWNLVFIQYNAEDDGTFRPLPACHVDTGMGFERVCSVMQGTGGFKDFTTLPSNYNTDVFAPLFDITADISGKRYTRTMPDGGAHAGLSGTQRTDIAFRVIADHLRTLSFSIADGILPGNTDRNYVLRRILRRAVRYGRELGLGQDGAPFLSRLLPALVEQMGDTFPELARRQAKIAETLDAEESSFNVTLDRGLALFEKEAEGRGAGAHFPAETAFRLSDTFGFPIDLTALLCAERGLTLDEPAVQVLLEGQREQSRAAQKKTRVVARGTSTDVKTVFTGFDEDASDARLVDVIEDEGKSYLIVDRCPLYVEMGGQLGDTGTVHADGEEIPVKDVLRIADAIALEVDKVPDAFGAADDPLPIRIHIDQPRRRGLEGHHTTTHLLHWALHEVVGRDAAQQGSLVAPDRLRFDFNSGPLTPEQLRRIEDLVNEKIADDDPVVTAEIPHSEIQGRHDIMQFFGDKYGERVRVVQVGGRSGALDGYSMELCGGTHVRRTSQIGTFRIKSEGAIAAGIRRLEAVVGEAATAYLQETIAELLDEATSFSSKLEHANTELRSTGTEPFPAPQAVPSSDDIDALTAYRDALRHAAAEADKTLRKAKIAAAAREAEATLSELIAQSQGSLIHSVEGTPALLQEFLNTLKKKQFEGVAILAVHDPDTGKIHLGTYVSPSHLDRFQAGKLMAELAPIVGGKGGGNPEMARGAGDHAEQLPRLLEEAGALVR